MKFTDENVTKMNELNEKTKGWRRRGGNEIDESNLAVIKPRKGRGREGRGGRCRRSEK
jgi:hypothetical protein